MRMRMQARPPDRAALSSRGVRRGARGTHSVVGSACSGPRGCGYRQDRAGRCGRRAVPTPPRLPAGVTPGLGLAPATSAPGPGSCRQICIGTGRPPPTSALGLGRGVHRGVAAMRAADDPTRRACGSCRYMCKRNFGFAPEVLFLGERNLSFKSALQRLRAPRICQYTSAHIETHRFIDTDIHTYMHACIHTYIHAYRHTYIHRTIDS